MSGLKRLIRSFFWLVCLSGWLMMADSWADPVSPPIDPPQFVNTPVQYIVEGDILVDRFAVWARGWQVEQVTFKLTGPPGMRLVTMGRKDCCLWHGAVMWRPGQGDVSPVGHRVVIEAEATGGQRITQSYFLYVINRNDPPVISSTPTLQTKEGVAWQYQIMATDPDPTSDVLGYRLLRGPTGMVLNASGLLRWTPSSADTGRTSVVVEVTDGRGGRVLQSFVLETTIVQQPPVFRSIPLDAAVVGVPYVYHLQAFDPNPGDILQYRLLSGPPGMTFVAPNTLQWMPAQTGTVAVNAEVTDQAGNKVQQSFQIKVEATLGGVPAWTSQPLIQAQQGTLWQYDASATDPDGDSLRFALVEAPEGMTLTPKSSGVVTLAWTPGPVSPGGPPVSVVLRVDDGKGGVIWQRFALVVSVQGSSLKISTLPPLHAVQGELLSYQVEAHSTPGATLRFSLNQAPTGMQIDEATGLLKWLPDATQVGQHAIEIIVEDDLGGRQLQVFSLEVLDRNDPPQITSVAPTEATEGTLFQYQLKATDPDGAKEVLGYRWQQHPASMKLDSKTGLITWTPAREDVGTHSIVVEAFDVHGGRGEQSFVLVVKPINQPPRVISTPILSAQVGVLYWYQIRVIDPDLASQTNAKLQFTLLQGPQGLKLDPLTGRISWMPQPEDAGEDQKPVKVLISDRVNTVTHSFAIRVYTSNQPPVVTSGTTLQVKEGELLKHQIEAKDPEGEKLLFVVEEAPEGLQVDAATGALQWRPGSWQVGTFGAQIRIDDQHGGLQVLRLTIEVDNQNNPPLIISQPPASAHAGKPYTYVPHAIDADVGTLLQWSLIKWPSGMTLDAATGRVDWTPTSMQIGVHDVILQASDGIPGGTVTQQFLVVVGGGNRSPVWKSAAPPTQGRQGIRYEHIFEASDPDVGDQIAYILQQAPDGVSLDKETGLLQWLPGARQVGKHDLEIQAIDSQGNAIDLRFSVEIIAANQAPQIQSIPLEVAMVGQPYVYDLQAIDPDGDPVAFSLLAQPPSTQTSQMVLDASGRQIQWTPDASHAGKRFLVSIRALDTHQGEAWQHFVLAVSQSANRAPTWKVPLPTGAVKIDQGQAYALSLSAVDADGDTISYQLALGPPGMLVTPQGALSWMPSAQQIGTHQVAVLASDGKGGVGRGQWQIEVTNRNDPPRITSIPANKVHLGQTFSYALRLEDPDLGVDAQEQLSLLLAIAPPGMTMDPLRQTLSWTPQPHDAGSHVVQVRVRDRLGLAATQLFRLEVVGGNQPPQIISQAPTRATEGQVFQYQVKASDPDGPQRFQYQLLQSPSGMIIDINTGLIVWTPNNRDALSQRTTVLVQVADETGATATQEFVLQVDDTNEPPRFVSPPCRDALTGIYNCVLLVEDADPLPWQLTVTKIVGPDDLQVEVGKGANGQRVSVLLKWAPTPQDVGNHLVVLEASDGTARASISFHIVVSSNRDAPIADPGPDRDLSIEPGEFILDGSASRDAQGDKTGLSYLWTLLQGPVEFKIPTPNSPKVQIILRASGAYIFQLVVTKGEKRSVPAQVRVSVRNLPPTANIFAPMAAHVERSVTLDGRGSEDANGDVLRFRWKQLEGPSVQLDLSDPRMPTWTPSKPGLYQFSLVVEEERLDGLNSKPALVEIAVHAPSEGEHGVYLPHAVIRSIPLGLVGTTMVLDGSRSRGLASERLKTGLQYKWRVIDGPASGGLSTPQQAKTNFVPQLPGQYEIGLVVSNNLHHSIEARQLIFIRDKGEQPLPIASPVRRYATFEEWTQLDGRPSRGEPTGGQLFFEWTQQLSLGGLPVTLLDARSSQPSFFVLGRSPYFFQLQVRADGPDSVPASFMVLTNEAGNQPPVADAGKDKADAQAVSAGQVTTLDGSKSQDPDAASGQELIYRWRQVSGFPVALHDAHKANPSFVPITFGILSFSLQVFDGKAWSWPATVQIVAHDETNHVPSADPGPEQKVLLQQSVTLDGSKSQDLDPDDELTFQWRLVEPQGAQVLLDRVDPKRPSFTAKDRNIARYVFGLTVDDGKSSSLERFVTIQVLNANQPPQARIIGVTTAFVGEEIELNGSKSQDPDKDPLTFAWKQMRGASIPLPPKQESILRVRFPSEGTYIFVLQVFDGFALSAPESITIQVSQRPKEEPGCGCHASPPTGTSRLPVSIFLLVLLWLWMWSQRLKKAICGRR